MPDAYEVLQTALAPALKALNDAGRYKLEQAKQENERAYELARTQDQRNYERMRSEDQRKYENEIYERRRKEREDDAAKDRLRGLRNELAGLLPPGQTVSPTMTEEQLHSEIAKRTRDQKVQWDTEDADRRTKQHIEEANKLDDAKLIHEAQQFGVKDADKRPIADVRKDLATAKTKMDMDLASERLNTAIATAKNSDAYKEGQIALGRIAYKMDQVSAALVPLPQLTGIEPEDMARIAKRTAEDPSVIAVFAGRSDGGSRLAALSKGDYAAVVKGLKPSERDELMQTILARRDAIQKSVEDNYTLKNKAAVNAYWKKVDDIPQMMSQLTKERDELIAEMNKLPLPVGTALRFDDRDNQKKMYMERYGVTLPGSNTDTKDVPPGDKKTAQNPGLPPPGQFASANPNKVAGFFPSIGNSISSGAGSTMDYARKMISNPEASTLLNEGGSQLTGGVSSYLDNIGSGFHNSSALLFGGELHPAPSLVDATSNAVVGAGKLTAGAARALGVGLEDIRPGLDNAFGPVRNAGNSVHDWIWGSTGPNPVPATNSIVTSPYE